MNKFFFKIVLLSNIFFFLSCATVSKSVPNEIRKCIERDVAKSEQTSKYKKQQSLEQTFKIFEDFLVEENYIATVSKKEYRELIKSIIEDPKSYAVIWNHVNNSEIYEDYYYIMNPTLMLTQCSDYVLVTEKHDYRSTINLQNNIVKRIIGSGYSNFGVIEELFTATPDEDFDELIYRIPFIYTITMNSMIH